MIRSGWLREGGAKEHTSPLPCATIRSHQRQSKTPANLTLVGIAYLSLTISLIALLGLAVVVTKMELILAADVTAGPATVSPTVKGQVVMIVGEMCVVRDVHGKGVLLQIGKGTKVGGTMKAGDKVEARMSPDGQVLSLNKVP